MSDTRTNVLNETHGNRPHELVEQWRDEAEFFRRRGQEALAGMAESYAAELETTLQEHAMEELTLQEATQESGYSYSALQKMVANSELQNVGEKHRPRVRRCDLPRKAKRASRDSDPDLAGRILASR
jgi:hypothetical protein